MHKKILQLGTLSIFLLSSYQAFSAQVIILDHQSPTFFASLVGSSPVGVKELTRETDFNQTLHVRFQQTYAGYPVWGGEGVMHLPHSNIKQPLFSKNRAVGSMNGKMYQGLKEDLISAPQFVFSESQAQKALQQAKEIYQRSAEGFPQISHPDISLMVYLDKLQKAQWVFKVSFDVAPRKARALPERPVYILNATTFEVYKHWDDIKTLDSVKGGLPRPRNKCGVTAGACPARVAGFFYFCLFP